MGKEYKKNKKKDSKENNKKILNIQKIKQRWIRIDQFYRETSPKSFILNPCDILYGKPAYFSYLMQYNITKIENNIPYIDTIAYNKYLSSAQQQNRK